MPSFSIALTGLQADSVALNTIGNNLANLNTSAFKKQDAKFADLFYQNIGNSGANNPIQVGVGTRISSIDTNFGQGNLASNTNPANMALNGDGFFVVQRNGVEGLTRAGDFQVDTNGNLITSSGMSVMGYPPQTGGANTNLALQPIHIPLGTTQLPSATTSFSLTASLDANAPVGTQIARPVTMYDSLGKSHDVAMSFTKSGNNAWTYGASLPNGDAATSTGTSGTLTFNTDGTLAGPVGTSSPITFGGLSDGAADLSLSWQLRDGTGNGLITQTSTASSINGNTQNGHASGTYQSFSVDNAGLISGLYSNGQTESLGQIAVATVANPEGLSRQGNNLYEPSEGSGAPSIGIAGTGSRGLIVGSSLEQSNVDISTEFSDLIVAQRSFQANAKTVTAFDTVTQDTINMIR